MSALSRKFPLSKTTLSVMGALLLSTLVPAAHAKRINPALLPATESIMIAPEAYPHETPSPAPPMPPKPPSIDTDIQNTVRDALQEPAQAMPIFIPDQRYDRVIEMVFAIDTTGSMGGLIEGAKQKVWRIINDVTQKQKQSGQKVLVRVGLVAYRDLQDDYVTRVTPLSSDLDAVYSQLMSFQAQGGGDTPENVRLAMSDALNREGWMNLRGGNNQALLRERVGKLSQVLFLVGDAPPHDDYQQLPSVQNTAKKARQSGIFVNAIQVGNIRETEPVWREVAQLGGGEYFAIAQNGGVQAIATPYDAPLAKLGDDMSAKGLYYGRERAKAVADSAGYAVAMAPAPITAKADRAKNKSINLESAYNASDLVQAVENKSVDLAKVKTEDLPDEMQKMSAMERQTFIEQKISERAAMRQQITDLSKQRDAYLREHEAGSADAFDTAVAKALNRQIQ